MCVYNTQMYCKYKQTYSQATKKKKNSNLPNKKSVRKKREHVGEGEKKKVEQYRRTCVCVCAKSQIKKR